MSDLIAVAYPDINRAEEVMTTLKRMQKEYLIDLADAATVTRDTEGNVKLSQMINLTAAGAASGGFWGMLIGMLFLNPLLGLAVGAGTGAIAGKLSDTGIDDGFMKTLGEKLKPGASAVFTLVRKSSPEKVLAEISKFGGTVLRTSLSPQAEARLQAALDAGTAPAHP
jgi:uncharacterized membrane protein